MGLGFDEKKIIEDTTANMEIVSAELNDTYGPQLAVKLKVLSGEHEGFTFMDYSSRDEDTGNIRQGTKAWSIFQAALGVGFHEDGDVDEEDLVGEKIMGRITQTKTGSRNKLEFGTIGPYQEPKKRKKGAEPVAVAAPAAASESTTEEDLEDLDMGQAPF
jgi:hypothetical protein